MNIAKTGNAIYSALKDDPTSIATIRTEYASLALKLATDPNATAQVTSSTVNGQSFATSQAMTNGQRLHLLKWVCACVDRGAPISTTVISNFK